MNDLKSFIAKQGLTQASVARSLGVSSSVVSQYIQGKYTSNKLKTLEKKISTYIANYQEQSGDDHLLAIVKTTDLKMINGICSEIAVNRDMGVIYRKAGTGKTVAIKDFVKKHPESALVETLPMMTVKELLAKILDKLGQKNAQGSVNTMIEEAVKLFKKSERILIIDEAENLTTKSLEAIRRIHDFNEVPVVLVGTYALVQNLKGRRGELLQLYSRVNNKWETRGLSDDDRKGLFGELGKHIKRYTSDIRRSVNIFKKAKRLSQLADEAMTAQHIAMASRTVILD